MATEHHSPAGRPTAFAVALFLSALLPGCIGHPYTFEEFDGLGGAIVEQDETPVDRVNILITHGFGNNCVGHGAGFTRIIADRLGLTPRNGVVIDPESLGRCDPDDLNRDTRRREPPSGAVFVDGTPAPLNLQGQTGSIEICRRMTSRNLNVRGNHSFCRVLESDRDLTGKTHTLGLLRVTEYDTASPTDPSGSRISVWIYELTWDPITRGVKADAFQADAYPEFEGARAHFNSQIKQAINYRLSDAILYFGKYSDFMKLPMILAICWMDEDQPTLADTCSVASKSAERGRLFRDRVPEPFRQRLQHAVENPEVGFTVEESEKARFAPGAMQNRTERKNIFIGTSLGTVMLRDLISIMEADRMDPSFLRALEQIGRPPSGPSFDGESSPSRTSASSAKLSAPTHAELCPPTGIPPTVDLADRWIGSAGAVVDALEGSVNQIIDAWKARVEVGIYLSEFYADLDYAVFAGAPFVLTDLVRRSPYYDSHDLKERPGRLQRLVDARLGELGDIQTGIKLTVDRFDGVEQAVARCNTDVGRRLTQSISVKEQALQNVAKCGSGECGSAPLPILMAELAGLEERLVPQVGSEPADNASLQPEQLNWLERILRRLFGNARQDALEALQQWEAWSGEAAPPEPAAIAPAEAGLANALLAAVKRARSSINAELDAIADIASKDEAAATNQIARLANALEAQKTAIVGAETRQHFVDVSQQSASAINGVQEYLLKVENRISATQNSIVGAIDAVNLAIRPVALTPEAVANARQRNRNATSLDTSMLQRARIEQVVGALSDSLSDDELWLKLTDYLLGNKNVEKEQDPATDPNDTASAILFALCGGDALGLSPEHIKGSRLLSQFDREARDWNNESATVVAATVALGCLRIVQDADLLGELEDRGAAASRCDRGAFSSDTIRSLTPPSKQQDEESIPKTLAVAAQTSLWTQVGRACAPILTQLAEARPIEALVKLSDTIGALDALLRSGGPPEPFCPIRDQVVASDQGARVLSKWSRRKLDGELRECAQVLVGETTARSRGVAHVLVEKLENMRAPIASYAKSNSGSDSVSLATEADYWNEIPGRLDKLFARSINATFEASASLPKHFASVRSTSRLVDTIKSTGTEVGKLKDRLAATKRKAETQAIDLLAGSIAFDTLIACDKQSSGDCHKSPTLVSVLDHNDVVGYVLRDGEVRFTRSDVPVQNAITPATALWIPSVYVDVYKVHADLLSTEHVVDALLCGSRRNSSARPGSFLATCAMYDIQPKPAVLMSTPEQ